MKNSKTVLNIAVFATILAVVLTLMLSVSAYDHDQTYNANATYFVPEDIRLSGYCTDTTVDIYVNTSVAITGGVLDFTYTFCCTNVTDFTINTTNWANFLSGVVLTPGKVHIVVGQPAGVGPGRVHIGTATIHCCNESIPPDCCVTNLAWDTVASYVEDAQSPPKKIPLSWKDGTFMCGNPIEVNKTVWNGTAWVEEIPDAQMDEIYRFRCEIHSKCCDLTNIAVVDTLSDSLEYAQNATVDGTPKAPDWISGNQFGWNFAGPLNPCNTIVIEFDARVVDYGYDCNIQNATAICEETGVEVSDEDDACINVPLPKPDLIVESITPNCGGYLFGNESNEICAKITNLGAAANASNASFVLSDGYSEIVGVPALAAGTNTTVCINDPTIRSAGAAVNINVTADCNGEIDESNETNNASDIDVTVVNQGYKGKRYTGGEDINTWKTFELQGDLLYSFGDSYYASGSGGWTNYNITWAASDLPVPGTATDIKEARLYVPYTYAKDGAMPNNYSMTFNDNPETFDVHYWDTLWYDRTYPYYGMLVYNVTANFNTSGNTANFTSLWSGLPAHSGASMRGMVLVVVYQNDSEPLRTIYVNEEFDILYGGSSKCTTPAEATAYAPFGAIDPSSVTSATLITVAPGAGPNEGELSFNGQIIGTDVWNYGGSSQIGINETDVTSYLNATDNEANFQSSGDWMEASNAFLVLQKAGVKISVEPEVTIIQPQDQFDVNITVEAVEALGDTKVYGVEYYLVYNKSVVRAETQNKGPFLGGYTDTIVVINDIDQANGIVSYAETRKVPDGVDGKDTVATIQFTAIGERRAMSTLDLFGVIVVDEDKNEIPSVIITDGTVTINDNIPPVANGTSKHEFNNVAKKYPCNTLLCSCSYDDNYPDKGGNITYIRWAFGDGQYGTTEGLPVNNCTCKEHKYESWQWDPSLPDTNKYVPFNVSLTVTDDGCPEETTTTFFDVNVFIAGDANGDGRVNILDAVYVGKHWGQGCSPTEDPCVECYSYLWADEQQDKADLNNDCTLNILDAVIIGANWGHVAW